MLSLNLVWIASIITTIVIWKRLDWWLIWRLLVIVPLFADIYFITLFGNKGGLITLDMLMQRNTWFSLFIFLASGIVFFGPTAIALGGLAWIAVRASLRPEHFSAFAFASIGTLVGGLAGVLFEIVTRAAFGDLYLTALLQWFGAWIVGGAVSGFIVAFHARSLSVANRRTVS